MRKGEQAMVPDFFKPAIEEATKEIKKPKKGDDDLLLGMAESDAWELLKGMLEGIQNSLVNQSKKSVGEAKTWEEAAKIYYGRDVSVDTLQTVIDIVELRKKAKYAESAGKEE